MFEEYNEFFDIIWHTDDNGNKVSIQRINEQYKIVNGKIILNGIPDSFYKVTISNKYEVNSIEQIISNIYFKVNYLTGEVYFHSSLEGQIITIAQYYDRGLIKLYGKRVELQNENNLYDATNVEDFATEITNRVNTYIADTEDKYVASNILNDSSETGTTVKDALNNNKNKVSAHAAGTADKHQAENVTFSSTRPTLPDSDVKDAIETIDERVEGIIQGQNLDPNKDVEVLATRTSAIYGAFDTMTERCDNTDEILITLLAESVITKTTVASMQTDTRFTSGQVIRTKGYYTEGDGGGCSYIVQDSTTEPSSFYITLSNGKKAVMIDKIIHPSQVGFITNVSNLNTLTNVRNNWTILKNLIADLKNTDRQLVRLETLLTLNRVYAEWISGRACPIGFYSDSTTDGATTTGHVPSTSDNPTCTVTINESPNAYPAKLEAYIKMLHKDTDPVRCYNGGFDSESFRSGFGLDHWYNVWFRPAGSNVDFSDVRMIVVGFGTSDSINLNNTAETIDNYSRDLECAIIDCFLRGVQPVLQAPVLTTQHVGETVQYRNADESVTIIETVQKELCKKYNLEYLSMAEPVRKALDGFAGLKISDFLSIDDMVHPGNMGHRLHASYLATKFCPNIARIETGKNILDLFPGHPAYIPYDREEIISPATQNGKILKRVTVGYLSDRTYYYNWAAVDGNAKAYNEQLLRIPVYVEKPTALFHNNIGNQQAWDTCKNLSMYSTVLDSTVPKKLLAEQLKQPEPVYFSNKTFLSFLPVGLTFIDLFANNNADAQFFGGFYLADVDEHLDGFSLGRGSASTHYLTHNIKIDPILTTYVQKVSRRKDALKKHYNASDNNVLDICFTLEQSLVGLTGTYPIYTHFNDVQNYQDCYNSLEIHNELLTLKIKKLSGEVVLKSETVTGLNALLISGTKLKLSFTSKNYEPNGVLFQFYVNDVNKFFYNALSNELWSEGYGFDSPILRASNIYITTRTIIQGFANLDTLL